MERAELNNLTDQIIGAAIEVHRILGPGLLEHTYQSALMQELRLRDIKAQKEVALPCKYKGISLDCAYKADIIVEDCIILELKSTDKNMPVYTKQLFTYLKITNMKVGLLINFNYERLIDGLQRIVNNF